MICKILRDPVNIGETKNRKMYFKHAEVPCKGKVELITQKVHPFLLDVTFFKTDYTHLIGIIELLSTLESNFDKDTFRRIVFWCVDHCPF